ncbi:MAG: galactosyldiacylglycerol synthase [Clostridiales bacterium]|nr:galactosyldiacylglycerol synthase [Clostridiales bacterium]
MRVLLLTVTAGHGHTQAANVVMDYLKRLNIECSVLDTLDYINPILGESVDKGYLYSTRYTPNVYGRLYDMVDNRDKTESRFSIPHIMYRVFSKKLVIALEQFKPDLVICTHNFAAAFISYLQENGVYNGISIGIVTDFTIHPFWEETDLDYYVTANELLNWQAVKKGIDVEKIWPIGIPIHTKFANKISPSKARQTLGVEDSPTVLVMSGSMGHGDIESAIEEMDSMDIDFQIISVCGSNKHLKKKIDKMVTKKRLYNFGFVDNIDVFMDAAHCIVTKPGGLTISESLAKGLPIVIIDPIPGQEERNAEFLLNNGLALMVSETFPIDEAMYLLMVNEDRVKTLGRMAEVFAKPNATVDLSHRIMELLG